MTFYKIIIFLTAFISTSCLTERKVVEAMESEIDKKLEFNKISDFEGYYSVFQEDKPSYNLWNLIEEQHLLKIPTSLNDSYLCKLEIINDRKLKFTLLKEVCSDKPNQYRIVKFITLKYKSKETIYKLESRNKTIIFGIEKRRITLDQNNYLIIMNYDTGGILPDSFSRVHVFKRIKN